MESRASGLPTAVSEFRRSITPRFLASFSGSTPTRPTRELASAWPWSARESSEWGDGLGSNPFRVRVRGSGLSLSRLRSSAHALLRRRHLPFQHIHQRFYREFHEQKRFHDKVIAAAHA